jgi:hypothetical protein
MAPTNVTKLKWSPRLAGKLSFTFCYEGIAASYLAVQESKCPQTEAFSGQEHKQISIVFRNWDVWTS